MILSDLLTALLMGITGGLIPGPIIILVFKETISNSSLSFRSLIKYPIYTAISEAVIGVTLIGITYIYQVPQGIFHILSIIGSLILVHLAFQIFKSTKVDLEMHPTRIISFSYIFFLMVFNGPVWLFWLTVCLPLSQKIRAVVPFGDVLFITMYEIGVIIGISVLIWTFKLGKNVFASEKTTRRLNYIIATLLALLALKLFHFGVIYFIN